LSTSNAVPKNVWMEISHWEDYITKEQYVFTNMAFSITYSFHHLYTVFHICLSNWGRNTFEYSLVADIIIMVRSTHDFKAVLKCYQKDNHTRKTIFCQCQMFLR